MLTKSVGRVKKFLNESTEVKFHASRACWFVVSKIYSFTVVDLFRFYSTGKSYGFCFVVNSQVKGDIWLEYDNYDNPFISITINEDQRFNFPISNTINKKQLNKKLRESTFLRGGNTLCLSILHKVFNPLVYKQWQSEKHNIAEIIMNDITKILPRSKYTYYDPHKDKGFVNDKKQFFGYTICCNNTEGINSQNFVNILLNTKQYQERLRNKLHTIQLPTYILLLDNISLFLSINNNASRFDAKFTIKTDYIRLENEIYYSTIGEYIHKLNIYSRPDCPYDLSDLQEFASTFGIQDDDRHILLQRLKEVIYNLKVDDVSVLSNR